MFRWICIKEILCFKVIGDGVVVVFEEIIIFEIVFIKILVGFV